MDEFISTPGLVTGIVAALIATAIVSVAIAWWAKRRAFANQLAQIAAWANAKAENIVRGMKAHFAVTVATLTLAGIVLGIAVSGPVLDHLRGWDEERRATRSQEEQRDLENRWTVTCADKCLEDCEYSIERCAREAIDLASSPGRAFTSVSLPQADRHFGSCLRENGIPAAPCPNLTAACVALRQMRSEDRVYYVGLRKYNGGWQPESASSAGCQNLHIPQGPSNSATRQEAPSTGAE